MTLESIKDLFQPDERWGPCETPQKAFIADETDALNDDQQMKTYKTYTTNENESKPNDETRHENDEKY